MPLVTAHRVSMHFGGPLLLDGVSLKVEAGARIGLIGRNGCGKSTLLRLLAGRLEPTAGEIVRPRGTRVAFQAQEMEFAPGRTVFEEMRSVFHAEAGNEQALREIEHRLGSEEDREARERLLEEWARRHRRQETSGVYDVDVRIARVLTSLGLPEPAWEQEISAFSGGERNVIALARVLLADPDLMLLDEPSNHLDMDGVEWFIDLLRHTRAGVVMVSHNRHLLDATVDQVWEMRGGQVTAWAGSYGDYQRQKAEALALQERQYKVQQRLIERIQFQARRLLDMANAYDDPGQAKRAKAMLRRLDQMEKVDRPEREGRRFRGSLAGGSRHGRIALAVEGFSYAYGDRVLFDGANLEIEYGERVCLVGPNGSGKTTLFREVLAHGSWENPTLRLGKSVKVGEYRQLHDLFDPEATVIDWLTAVTRLPRPPAADLLHRFLFAFEDLERPIATLSGGEKSRLQLARLAHEKVNLLLLDEPTNHLDIASCEVLEEMLQEYDGTLLVISHDRYFLDRLVDRVVEVRDRGLVDHRATFAEWFLARGGRKRRGALEGREEDEAAAKEEARRAFQEERERRRERDRLLSRLRDLEARIAGLEDRQRDLEARLEAAFSSASGHEEGARLSEDLARLKAEVADGYAAWETTAASLESAGADPSNGSG